MFGWRHGQLNLSALPSKRSSTVSTVGAGAPRTSLADAEEIRWQRDRASQIRSMGAYCAAALVFIRFSATHEIITSVLHVNTFVLYIFGVPAILAWLISGGARRSFPRSSPVIFWLAFAFWMVLATPFSSWRGGSTGLVLTYLRTVTPFAVLVAGLPLTWQECRRVAYAIALAAPVILVSSRLFLDVQMEATGRVASELTGTIANSNDIAGMLVVTLPFVLFVVVKPKTMFLVRMLGAGVIAYGIYILLHTASRGAMLGLFAGMALILIRANTRQRIGLVVIGGVAVVSTFAVLPAETVQRLLTFSASEEASGEALASQDPQLS